MAEGRPSRLRGLGEWCARHFVLVIVGWLIAIGAVQGLQHAFGGIYSDDFSLPGSQSQQGLNVLVANAPAAGGQSGTVVLYDAQGPLTGVSAQVNQVVTSLGQLPHVTSAANPLPSTSSSAPPPAPATSPPPPGTPLSADGKTAFITVKFNTNPATLGQDYLTGVDAAVAPLRAAGVEVEYGGPLGELDRPKASDLTSEGIGFAVAIVVLLIGFGSVIAAVYPLVSALAGVVVGLGCLGLIAKAATFASVSPTLATMIGLGVGIDYALFLLTRHRQQLMDGADPVVSAGRAAATSGHAVLVSGTTVIIALLGLWASDVSFIGRLGIAAAVTVITAVLAALTLVPALLGLAGRSIDRFHVRTPVAEAPDIAPEGGGGEQHSGWHTYARRVERHPFWFMFSGVVVLGVLAIPLFSIQLGHIDDGADPTTFTDRRAFDLVSSAFGPGANGPLTIVVDQTNVPSSARSSLQSTVSKSLTSAAGPNGSSPLQPAGNGDVLVSTVYSAERPQAAGTTDLVNSLKNDVLPASVSGTGATGYVTGTTAAQVDFLDIVSARLPLIIAVVVGLAFLIILTVFRGPLIALKAAVLNLLSIGASYGVVVAVFQWGWGGPQLGVSGTVPIESYVPMMMFAIVFGLSMDYEVFLLSRVRETWLRTKNAKDSVAHALELTARVITCAALIMVSVFAAFLLSDTIVVKMLGLGLAVSVLIDATVVRLLLVPAVMTVLGKAAWWSPRWLDRILPHVGGE
jgi:RND superfamily putative drug exporter